MVVVGDGPLRSRLAADHPGTVFTGALPNLDLARHYASADLFLFPSTSETWGNVLVEAMASGLACVAYDYAAARHHVRDGINGLLAPVGDERTFTAAALLAGGDAALRRRLGAEARRTAIPIAWERVAGRFEELLLRVAEEGLEELPV
jgi:glycosyltransferase involved in cell wall biosynthesis